MSTLPPPAIATTSPATQTKPTLLNRTYTHITTLISFLSRHAFPAQTAKPAAAGPSVEPENHKYSFYTELRKDSCDSRKFEDGEDDGRFLPDEMFELGAAYD